MPDEERLTAAECRARLEQIECDLVDLPPGYGAKYARLMECKAFFTRALQRCVTKESRKEKTMNSNRNDGSEIYGDGMGRSGNGTEQADVAKSSLRYQDRFNQNSEPAGHDMGDTDKVRG